MCFAVCGSFVLALVRADLFAFPLETAGFAMAFLPARARGFTAFAAVAGFAFLAGALARFTADFFGGVREAELLALVMGYLHSTFRSGLDQNQAGLRTPNEVLRIDLTRIACRRGRLL